MLYEVKGQNFSLLSFRNFKIYFLVILFYFILFYYFTYSQGTVQTAFTKKKNKNKNKQTNKKTDINVLSQNSPVNSGSQEQENPSPRTLQSPPLRHGEEEHGSTAVIVKKKKRIIRF